MSIHSYLSDFLGSAFRDRHRKYVIVSLLVVGIVLIVIGQQAAGRGPAMPQEPPSIEVVQVTRERHGHCYLIQEGTAEYKVGRAQKYDLECIVSDTRFALSYKWSCDAGELSEISADGSAITWTAPDTSGQARVTVTVSDAAGQTSAQSIAFTVVSCSPCTFRGCG